MSEERWIAIIARFVGKHGEFIELEPICEAEAQTEAKTARKPVPRRDPLSEERD